MVTLAMNTHLENPGPFICKKGQPGAGPNGKRLKSFVQSAFNSTLRSLKNSDAQILT